tara:strand:- start:229 stop:876 length:648 start_codon:yes stop_codon:yes gene_type:complete
MATAKDSLSDRLSGTDKKQNPTDTLKENYDQIGYGNRHGTIRFGEIHKDGAVTAAVMLTTPEGKHNFSLDEDGERKGWTCSTSPGNFNVNCGEKVDYTKDACSIEAENGNIVLRAKNGKIRMYATDFELMTTAGKGGEGNITMTATETIEMSCKKLLTNASIMYKIASPGKGEIVANEVLKMYGSIIKGVTDACAVKDVKTQGFKIYNEEQNQVD